MPMRAESEDSSRPESAPFADPALEAALSRAGSNRAELERALREAPEDQRAGMRWLVERMPDSDARTVRAEFLLEHCDGAYRAWRGAPWRDRVPEALFLDAILPFANVSERREQWMAPLRALCLPMVDGLDDPGLAAARINQQLFPKTKVIYSTKRRRADQSPSETIESGLASCTGLSILLIDACRSVGIPARFVGTPLWTDRSGNHSWVEVWDGTQWRFTGAAEPTGDRLDEGWFSERASTARQDSPLHAIYAVTWRDTPVTFPMEWSGYSDSVRAVDVTSRYTQPAAAVVPYGMARVRFRVTSASDATAAASEPPAASSAPMRIRAGDRLSVPVTVTQDSTIASPVFTGTSRDERCDSNDHLTTLLPLGASLRASVPGADPVAFKVERDGQLVEIVAEASPAIASLRDHLSSRGLEGLAEAPFASAPLSRAEAERARELIWRTHVEAERERREREIASGEVRAGGTAMRFWSKPFGERPPAGRSLWISMHGGGGAPARVNDQQWENQKRLYAPEEGLYLVPRAPTDTWNLWHQDHIDALLARLIESLVIAGEVDPDRVYIMGYSAGGDGVYQLAPRMADRLAAAAMMAGHPNDAKPDGLRNIAFALHMGEKDAAFERNAVAKSWAGDLARRAAQEPGAYRHQAVIHPGKGHWMDRQDAMALPWMAGHARDPRPTKVVWLQDDVTHPRFYWLAAPEPKAGARVVASRSGNAISIDEADGVESLRIRLDDRMCNLDEPVTVMWRGREAFRGTAPRTIAAMARCLGERSDPSSIFVAEIPVQAAATPR